MNKRYRLVGSIPSKKNSRTNTRSGRSFPSKAFADWQEYAMSEILVQGLVKFKNPIRLTVAISFKDNRRQDLDNRISSILDMLVKVGVIEDDCWKQVPQIQCYAELSENKQTETTIIIEELGNGS